HVCQPKHYRPAYRPSKGLFPRPLAWLKAEVRQFVTMPRGSSCLAFGPKIIAWNPQCIVQIHRHIWRYGLSHYCWCQPCQPRRITRNRATPTLWIPLLLPAPATKQGWLTPPPASELSITSPSIKSAPPTRRICSIASPACLLTS